MSLQERMLARNWKKQKLGVVVVDEAALESLINPESFRESGYRKTYTAGCMASILQVDDNPRPSRHESRCATFLLPSAGIGDWKPGG